MKKFSFLIIILFSARLLQGQSIAKATLGSIGGQFRNGNVILNYTLGEAFTGTQNNGNVQLGTGFWSVVPAGYTSSAATIFRFTGDGNFFDAANWENNKLPPNPLPAGNEIIIAPAADGAKCVLNQPFQVAPGGKFSVIAGKSFIVVGQFNLK